MSITGNNLPVYATSPQNYVGSLTNGSGAGTLGADTNGVVIYTAGANGSRVYGTFLSTTDTSADNIFFYIKTSGGSVCPIGQINVPASSGNTAGTPCVDALASANCPGLSYDGTGKPYVELAPNAYLKISAVSAVTSGKTLYAATIGADY